MIFYLSKLGQMTETKESSFFDELRASSEPLVYIDDEKSIDIIRQSDIGEYDFSHMVAFIEIETAEEVQVAEIKQKLNEANLKEEE